MTFFMIFEDGKPYQNHSYELETHSLYDSQKDAEFVSKILNQVHLKQTYVRKISLDIVD